MPDPALEQQILDQLTGVRLHRQRELTPFAHVADEPLLDVLFSITRAAPRIKRTVLHSPEPPAEAPAEPLIPKGMVDYRRELRRDFGSE